jgi:ATP-dependent Clp protease ATP-binding subunit ClpA
MKEARRRGDAVHDKIPQALSAKNVITRAIEEAQDAQHQFVGTGHILLGLLRIDDPASQRLLAQPGVTLEGVRAAVASRYESRSLSDVTVPTDRESWAQVIRDVESSAPGHIVIGKLIEALKSIHNIPDATGDAALEDLRQWSLLALKAHIDALIKRLRRQ